MYEYVFFMCVFAYLYDSSLLLRRTDVEKPPMGLDVALAVGLRSCDWECLNNQWYVRRNHYV
jgi:hypothetical protein